MKMSVKNRAEIERCAELLKRTMDGSLDIDAYLRKKKEEEAARLEAYDKAQNEYWAKRKAELAAIKAAREAAAKA